MAFNVPINSIAPTPTSPDWVRPSDWIVITDSPNEVQYLVCDLNTKSFTIRTTFTRTSGNIYIDWGDGVTDTVSTTTLIETSHVYSTGGTPCSRGYNTWKIRIYGDATCVITNARQISNVDVTSGGIQYPIGVLEAYFGDNTCNTAAFYQNYFRSGDSSGAGSFNYLEYVKLPSTVSWGSVMANMFSSCVSLYKVIMPTSASSLGDMASTFSGCNNLLSISFPSNATLITSLSSCFLNCSSLESVTLPTSLDACTNLTFTFNNCAALKNITLPSINLVTQMGSTFSNCTSLQWVRFTSLPSPASSTAISATSMMSNCSNLQNVYFPSSCSSNARMDMGLVFNNCYSLKRITFPLNFNPTSLSSTFLACSSLTSVIFQSNCPDLTTMSSAFSGCVLLNSVTLPSSVGASITLANAFNTCKSLVNIVIPSTYVITSLANTFQECSNLFSITLPNNAQNSCTTMSSMANGCNRLTSIVMPTSLTAVTTLANAFDACYELTSISLPSTMNSVTTMASCFRNCSSLKSATLPTSASSCTIFSSIFENCRSITEITLPSTVSSATTTFASAFSFCSTLKTLTFPTTQMSSVNTIVNMIGSCGALITINNLNRVGSLTATPLVNGAMGSSAAARVDSTLITSLSFSCPFSQFSYVGSNPYLNKLTSLRLLNTGAGQYTTTSPHININFSGLNATALNQVFTDLPTLSGKTISIIGSAGAAGCTRSIATAKGWTVTG